jgi:hypothetical protein
MPTLRTLSLQRLQLADHTLVGQGHFVPQSFVLQGFGPLPAFVWQEPQFEWLALRVLRTKET